MAEYSGIALVPSLVLGRGSFAPNDYAGRAPLPLSGSGGGAAPTLYRCRGRYASAVETWTTTAPTTTNPVTGHVTTETSFRKIG